jgi:hypothetical protein
LLVEQGGQLQAVEIKSGATPGQDAMRGLEKWRQLAGEEAGRPCLVYGGSEAQSRSDIDILPWREL